MTYNNNIMQSQQQTPFSGAMGQTGSMFQPGYANTNVHEVQYWNQGGHSPATITPTYGMNYGGSGTQAMFQPGFANTNVQEVRQLNSGYNAPQQQGYQQTQMNSYQQQVQPINYLHPHNTGYVQAQPSGYMQTQTAYQPTYGAATNSIFSAGFAGTNIQEVQQRNNTGYAGQTGYSNNTLGGSIFSPGFAGTNVQEVRQLNQGGAPSAGMLGGYGLHPQQQQPQQSYQSYGNSIGTGAPSIYSPGFAGTNVQEVRSLNHGGQMTAHTGSIFPGSM